MAYFDPFLTHFWDPFLSRSCSGGLKFSLREAIFQPKPVKNRSKSGPKRGQKWLKKGSFLGPLFDTLLTGYGWYLRQCSIELARAAQDLSKRGPKSGQKVVKKGSFLGPLFDTLLTGPGSDLRQWTLELARTAQNLFKSGPKMGQKTAKKGSFLDPFFRPLSRFGQTGQYRL
jgi:hypothetical protein